MVSEWTLLEFKDVLSNLILGTKLIKEGYVLPEFSQGKKHVFLESGDFVNIQDAASGIKSKYKKVKNHPVDINIIRSYIDNGISLLDAILVDQAKQESCMYFVTRDSNLVRGLSRQALSPKIPKIVNPKKFVKILQKL